MITFSGPMKIVQTAGLVAVLYELPNNFRQIFMDGRALPKDPNPTWQGYSVGRWEGETLVVETIGFNDKSWVARPGHPHTEALRVTERYRRVSNEKGDVTDLLVHVVEGDFKGPRIDSPKP